MTKKVLLLSLPLLVLLFLASCGGEPIRYAKIVNTDTALIATKIKFTNVKSMMVEPGDTVQVIDYEKGYSKVRLGLKDGFVPTDNLEIINEQMLVTQNLRYYKIFWNKASHEQKICKKESKSLTLVEFCHDASKEKCVFL